MDIDTVGELEARSPRFRRWLAVLVGVAAVTTALLAVLESDSGRREEQALVRSSRGSIQIFAEIAGSAPRTQFTANSLRQALGTEIGATARVIVTQGASAEATDVAMAVSGAQTAAARRLIAAVRSMSRVAPEAPLDPTTRTLLTADLEHIQGVLEEQNRQADLADRFGGRQERAMFAIALVAIGAVLLGLAGLVGERRAGVVSLLLAGVALVLAIGWGGSALLL
jgi:hypothetical protein